MGVCTGNRWLAIPNRGLRWMLTWSSASSATAISAMVLQPLHANERRASRKSCKRARGIRIRLAHRVWGRAFDNRGHGLFAAFSFKPSKRLVFYGRYDARVGDVVSTAVPTTRSSRPRKSLSRTTLTVSIRCQLRDRTRPDQTRPGPGLLNNNTRFAYRIDAVSHQGRVGANYAITPAMSVDVSGRYRATYGDGNNDYFGFNIQGALLYRF